jgi:hypothetical protein
MKYEDDYEQLVKKKLQQNRLDKVIIQEISHTGKIMEIMPMWAYSTSRMPVFSLTLQSIT